MNNDKKHFIPELFVITAKTNLHAGSGSENNGIIDNMIQKDHVTKLPCINSQSLKGAFREFFTELPGVTDNFVEYVFGSKAQDSDQDIQEGKDKVNEDEKNQKFKQGEYRFFQADLLSIPKPSDEEMYKIVSAKLIEKQFIDMLNFFEIECSKDWNQISNEEESLSNREFIELTNDFNLPVIARNHLENGESQNLWYEQLLPRETRLFFVILRTKNDDVFKTFKNNLVGSYVQIGANATIGYGYCNIEHIETSLNIKTE